MHEVSQRIFAFMTPEGVFMPTRTPQGERTSAANFQEKIEECFAELRDHFRAWLDDYLIFAETEDELLRILRRFFEICRERNLIVSLPKSDFFFARSRGVDALLMPRASASTRRISTASRTLNHHETPQSYASTCKPSPGSQKAFRASLKGLPRSARYSSLRTPRQVEAARKRRSKNSLSLH